MSLTLTLTIIVFPGHATPGGGGMMLVSTSQSECCEPPCLLFLSV